MARAALQLDAEALQVVARRQRRQDLDVAAVARAAVEVDRPGRIDPRPGLLQRGSSAVLPMARLPLRSCYDSLLRSSQDQRHQRQDQPHQIQPGNRRQVAAAEHQHAQVQHGEEQRDHEEGR